MCLYAIQVWVGGTGFGGEDHIFYEYDISSLLCDMSILHKYDQCNDLPS